MMAEPKLRFKRDDGSDYPEWERKSFKDSFIALNNNSFSRDMLNFDNGIVKNIHYGDILIKFGDICNIGKDIIPFVNSEYNTEKYDLLKDGDIILADTAEDEAVGKTIEIFNVRNNKVISGLHTIACRPITKYASKYLGYYMNSPSFHDQLRPFMQGIKVTSIGRKNISEVQICSPKVIDEQQKIADFLSAVDEVIAESEKEVTNLETQKKSVMKKIFSQEIRFTRPDSSPFPDWKENILGKIAVIKDSARIPNDKWKKYGVPYLRAKDFNSGNLQGELFISEEDYSSYKNITGAPEKGDLMFVSGGNVGLAVLKKDDSPVYVQGGAILYIKTSVSPDITGEFLLQYFSSEKAKSYIKIASVGGTIIHYTLKPANAMPIFLPCLEEQKLIADFLSDFDEAIAAAQKELSHWKQLKKALLQQLFV